MTAKKGSNERPWMMLEPKKENWRLGIVSPKALYVFRMTATPTASAASDAPTGPVSSARNDCVA